jgi:hypothetical protein
VRLLLEFGHAAGQFVALVGEHLPVDEYAGLLHRQQHRNQRLFDLRVDLLQGLGLAELGPQLLVQLQCDVCIFGGIRGRRLQVDLVERELLRALAGDIFVVNRLAAEVITRGRIHVVPRCDAVQYVGFEHRVECHAGEPDAVSCQDVGVVLQVVADLFLRAVFQPGPELFQHLVARQLLRGAGVVVRHGDVGGLARFDG